MRAATLRSTMPVQRPTHGPTPGTPPEHTAVHGRCHRCGERVIGCRDGAGRLVAVHPVAIPGGELIVNGSQFRIVQVLTAREASAAHRRGDLGFMPHARLCRRLGAEQ